MASHFVRPSGGGGGGTTWTDAWNGFSGINWGAVNPGDTVWVAGGTYAPPLTLGASGTSGSPVTIQRATASDGAVVTGVAGWLSGFDSAIIQSNAGSGAGININGQSFVTLDGRTNNLLPKPFGTFAGWQVNYGIGGSGVEASGSTAMTGVVLRYIKSIGPGRQTEGTNNETCAFHFSSSTGGAMSSWKVQFCEATLAGDSPVYFSSQDNNLNALWEYNFFHNSDCIDQANEHPNCLFVGQVIGFTFRYNVCQNIPVEGLFFNFGASDLYIYGNIFAQGSTNIVPASSGRPIDFDNHVGTVPRVFIYNNTFVDFDTFAAMSLSDYPNDGQGFRTLQNVNVKNNLVWRCAVNLSSSGLVSPSFNFGDSTQFSGETGSISNGTMPFASYSFQNDANDYHLTNATSSTLPRNKGTAISPVGTVFGVLQTFDKDMDGNTRGADGLWDIGAFEFSSGVADTTPPSVPGTPTCTNVGSTTLTVSWAASNDNVSTAAQIHYILQRELGTSGSFSTINTTANGVTSFNDTGPLTPNTAYGYRVQAIDLAGNVQLTYSGIRSVTTKRVSSGDDRFGFATHFAQGWGLSLMPLIAATGCSYIRDDLSTGGWEPTPGNFIVYGADKTWIDSAHANGLLVVGILNKNNSYASGDPYDPQLMANRAAFIAASGLVDVIEVTNEPNNDFQAVEGSATWESKLAALTTAVTNAVRAAAPNVTVIGLGAQGNQIISILGSTTVDGIVYHPYDNDNGTVGTFIPETVYEFQYTNYEGWLGNIMAATPLPLWETEWGAQTVTGFSEDNQATFLVRRLLIAMACAVDHSFIYEFRDNNATDLFGVYTQAGTAKASYAVITRLISVLQGVVGNRSYAVPASSGFANHLFGVTVNSVANGNTAQAYGCLYTGSNKTAVASWFGNASPSNPPASSTCSLSFTVTSPYSVGSSSVLNVVSGTSVPLSTYTTSVSGSVLTVSNLPISDHPLLIILTADTTPPSAPGTPTFSNIAEKTVTVSWPAANDNVSTAAQINYVLQRRLGASGGFSTINTTANGVTSFNDPGPLTGSTLYQYQVQANDLAGNPGPFSSIGSVTTAAPSAANPSMVQHLSTGSNNDAPTEGSNYDYSPGTNPGNPFWCTLPNPTLTGNALTLGLTVQNITFGGAATTVTVTDDSPAGQKNVWTQRISVNNGGAINQIWTAFNIAGGTQMITVTFNNGDSVWDFQADITEWCNVTGFDVPHSSTATVSPNVNSGAMTQAASGELIYNYAFDTHGFHTTTQPTLTRVTPGAGFSLLSACNVCGHFSQWAVGGGGVITPSATITTGTDAWNSLSVALTTGPQGSPRPGGMRIVKIYHVFYLSTRTAPLMFPAEGNLIFMASAMHAQDLTFQSPTDNKGNTWTETDQTGINDQNGASQGPPQSYWTQGATTGLDFTVLPHITTTGFPGGNFVFYDVVGAAASAYDSTAGQPGAAHTFTTLGPSGTTSNQPQSNFPTITPSTPNGLVFCVMTNNFGPTGNVMNVAGQVLDSIVYGGQTDQSILENSDGYAHFYNPTAVAVHFGWIVNTFHVPTTSISRAIAFKAASGSVTLTDAVSLLPGALLSPLSRDTHRGKSSLISGSVVSGKSRDTHRESVVVVPGSSLTLIPSIGGFISLPDAAGISTGTLLAFNPRRRYRAAAGFSPGTGTLGTASLNGIFAPQLVQSNSSTPSSVATITCTYAIAQKTGDVNVVIVGWTNATALTVNSVSDTANGAYTVGVPLATNGTVQQAMYYSPNIQAAAAGSNIVTVVLSGVATSPDVRILEYSGIITVLPLDVVGSATGNNASPSVSISSFNTSDLVVSGGTTTANFLASGALFTNRLLTADGNLADDAVFIWGQWVNGVVTSGNWINTGSVQGPWFG